MKKALLIILLCVVGGVALGQQEARWWYFGRKAGFDFGAGLSSPTMLYNGSQNNGDVDEGHATISDASGNLLFYTNGLTIWDKNGAAMFNGTGLNGDWSATQCATIFPVPGSTTSYYVITTPLTGSTNQVRYNIVDLNSATNGGHATGAVTTKNVVMPGCGTYMMEALVSCPHFNGTDVWVVAHGADNPSVGGTDDGNKFYVWRVSSGGISAVTTYSLGYDYQSVSGVSKGIGIMKFNSCFNRLFISYYNVSSRVEGFQFNNTSGAVSNWPAPVSAPLLLNQFRDSGGSLATMDYAYGIEVSPNGRYLYVTLSGEGTPGKEAQQYDLQAGTGTNANIQNSAVRLTPAVSDGVRYGQLQLGPDGKIYHTLHQWNAVGAGGYCKISVINTPNGGGTGAGAATYTEGQYTWPVGATGAGSTMGLPSFHKGFIAGIASVKPGASLGGLDQVCVGEPADFDANYTQSGTNWKWNIDANVGPNTTIEYTTQNIVHTYSTAGTYTVVLTLDDATCLYTVTETTQVIVNPIINSAGTTSCGSPIKGNVTSPNGAYTYVWYSDAAATNPIATGTTNVNLAVTGSGNVYLKAMASSTTNNFSLTNGPAGYPSGSNTAGSTNSQRFSVNKAPLSFTSFHWSAPYNGWAASDNFTNFTVSIVSVATSTTVWSNTRSVATTGPTWVAGYDFNETPGINLAIGNYDIVITGGQVQTGTCTSNQADSKGALTFSTSGSCISTAYTYTYTEISAANVACSKVATIPFTCPLPVSWLYFTGEKFNGGNLLTWATASEKNASRYEIERSENGIDFEKVGEVAAKGNSSQLSSYSFVDAVNFSSVVYYRLKEVDIDGKTQYSNTIAINPNSLTYSILPNPGNGIVYITGGTEAFAVQVLDLQGRMLVENPDMNSGELLDLENVAKGVYLIQIIEAGKVQTLRYVKQ